MRRTKAQMEIDAVNRSLGNYERLLRIYARAKAGPAVSEAPAPSAPSAPSAQASVIEAEPLLVEPTRVSEEQYRLSEAAQWFLRRYRSRDRTRI